MYKYWFKFQVNEVAHEKPRVWTPAQTLQASGFSSVIFHKQWAYRMSRQVRVKARLSVQNQASKSNSGRGKIQKRVLKNRDTAREEQQHEGALRNVTNWHRVRCERLSEIMHKQEKVNERQVINEGEVTITEEGMEGKKKEGELESEMRHTRMKPAK